MGSYEVVIVGGGPAGLSAALILGRCRRRVLLCDAGNPRNARSKGVHGFLTRDGVDPWELRKVGRQQLEPYRSVEVRDVLVEDAAREGTGFRLALRGGEEVWARKLLLATGVVDELPPVPGIEELWGHSVFPCPYCDAWEVRGRRLGVLGRGESALSLCRSLTCWSDDLVLFTNGASGLDPEEERLLEKKGIQLVTEPLAALEGRGAQLEKVRLQNGRIIDRDAVFLSAGQHQTSPLVARLGCQLTSRGVAATGVRESTNIPGLFVAGDASRNVQLAIVAAAEGAEAAFEINRSLVREDFESLRS